MLNSFPSAIDECIADKYQHICKLSALPLNRPYSDKCKAHWKFYGIEPYISSMHSERQVHVAPSCVGSGEGSDHFGSYVRNLSLHFCKRLFPGLEPMPSWSQGNNLSAALGLPFSVCILSKRVNSF
jgi:hypothetical protein